MTGIEATPFDPDYPRCRAHRGAAARRGQDGGDAATVQRDGQVSTGVAGA